MATLNTISEIKEDTTDSPESGLQQAMESVRAEFPGSSSLVDCVEACISAILSLLILDAEGCPAVLLEGPPSSRKTTALNFLNGEELSGISVRSDNFTPASFVSHAANRSLEELEKSDLLPRIRNKFFVVPDLAPTLTAKPEDVNSRLGNLTRVLDGQGYESDSGTHGHRGYGGDYRFTFLAATTPLSDSAWEVMGRVGNRLVIVEAEGELPSTETLIESVYSDKPYNQKVKICRDKISELVGRLWDAAGGYGSIQWDAEADDKESLTVIARLASWVVKCRGSATKVSDGREDDWAVQAEAPYRLFTTLVNLARGHAIASGRRNIEREDVQLVARIALDSMPKDRRRVIRALLRSEHGVLQSAGVENAVGKSRPTARKTMAILGKLGAVEHRGSEFSGSISLTDDERWLLEEENAWVLERVP